MWFTTIFFTALIPLDSPCQRWCSLKGCRGLIPPCVSVQARKLLLTAEGGRAIDDSLVLGKAGTQHGGG